MRGRPQTLKPAEKMELRLMREAGVSVKQCAGYWNVSMATAFRVLSELRKKLGPEKVKNRQLARWHLTARNSESTGI